MDKKSIIIPDQNLEAAIRRAINKPTGPITEEDLWVLQTSNAQVRSEDIVLWIHALTSDNHRIREAATFALRSTEYFEFYDMESADAYIPPEVKDPAIVEELLQILNEILNDAAVNEYRIYDYDVVAVLLGAIKEPKAIKPLIQIIKMLEDVSDAYSIPAVDALAQIGTVARTALIQSLKNHDRVVQEEILTALEGLEALTKTLEDEEAKRLEEIRREEERQTKEEDLRRVQEAIALAKMGDVASLELVIEALNNEDEDVREVATWGLGEIGDKKTVEPLRGMLDDEDEFVQMEARIALARMGDTASRELLIEALDDEDEHVRGVATKGLGEIGDVRDVEILKEMLDDEDLGVRSDAVWALKKIGTPEAMKAVEEFEKN